MRIITNNRPRPLVALCELPAKVQAEFDYIVGDDAYTPRLVQYKGAYYDVYDCQRVDRELGFDQFKGWHGIVSDSFFSGVLFRIADDSVVVGRYNS